MPTPDEILRARANPKAQGAYNMRAGSYYAVPNSGIGTTAAAPAAPAVTAPVLDMNSVYGPTSSGIGDFAAWQPTSNYGDGVMGGVKLTNYGIGITDAGVKAMTSASSAAYDDRRAAHEMAATGSGIGASGMSNQDAQINALIAQSQQRTPSAAQAQLLMANDANTRSMMAQAAAARGGNQAAAMRSAQAQASQNALITQQQAAALRAQEEQARQRDILAAREYAASAYGDRAKMGYGVYDSGIGRAAASTGTAGSIGAAVAGTGTDVTKTGVGQQDVYVDAVSGERRLEAEKDENYENRKDRRAKTYMDIGSGVIGGVAGGIVGGMF